MSEFRQWVEEKFGSEASRPKQTPSIVDPITATLRRTGDIPRRIDFALALKSCGLPLEMAKRTLDELLTGDVVTVTVDAMRLATFRPVIEANGVEIAIASIPPPTTA